MTFAYPLPWWALLAIAALTGVLAYVTYARAVVPLAPVRRSVLVGLRVATILALVLFLMRPIVTVAPSGPRDSVVPILIDASRSMRLEDERGQPRLEQAIDLTERELLPSLAREFQVEVLAIGESVAAVELPRMAASGRRSDLGGALRAVRERYRGRPVAGIVMISDGADTSGTEAAADLESAGPPVYAIGVGAARVGADREVLSVTAGEARLADSVIELSTTVVSHGYGRAPIEIRVLENGNPIQSKSVEPAADGSPARASFQVLPKRDAATLYTVEIPSNSGELASENNRRSVLVHPPGRQRRLLLLEGAPGFEHSFVKRALSQDRGLEVDAVVRKGQNERGEDTFYIQARTERSASLARGFPATKEALFAYDAVIIANSGAEFFTRDQLALLSDFVAARGGGVLLIGARSFSREGLSGTPLEEVLPVEISSRGDGVVRTSGAAVEEPFKLVLTPDGERHPMMQLTASPEESRKRWQAAPALAGVTGLGEPRPGASILATASTAGGRRPLVAVQRYGKGRSMVFAGEATWRWKMMLPVADRTYDTFWRQVARWLSTPAPDPISVTASAGPLAGDAVNVAVTAHDATFAAVRDASVIVQVSGPAGFSHELNPRLADGVAGRYATEFRAEQAGVYHVRAEARRGNAVLGTSQEWILVGGADLEFAEPRRNDEVLRRIAAASGGQVLDEADVRRLPRLLASRTTHQAPPEIRDLWHNGWTLAVVALLLSAEWILRRRWGLR